MLMYNGKFYIEREKFAEAIYIENGLIKEVGTTKELKEKYQDTEQYDCQGKCVIPGLNDSHIHLLMLGEGLEKVDTTNCISVEDLIERGKNFLKSNPKLKCLHSIGWNQDLFMEKRIPTREDLDKITQDIPVIFERVCGHILSTNTKAIELLGIDGNSPQWSGGTFEIGEDGYPNGVFTENACNYVKKLIPPYTLEERKKMLLKSMKEAVSYGITSVQSNDIGTTLIDDIEGSFDLFYDLYKEGKGILRYRHQVCFNNVQDFKKYVAEGEFSKKRYDDDWLTLGPLKLFKDGSLGARTALMNNEYNDDKGNYGEEWINNNDMKEYCKIAKENNIQVITHVIGDRAIEETLNCYKDSFIDGKNKLRHCLVHCQITDEKLLEDIAKNDILVMYQPIFLDYDMKIVKDRCGESLSKTSYAFKTLNQLNKNIVSYGTDCPVESCNPFPNIYSAVTRRGVSDTEMIFNESECVDVYTAIDCYTIGSAYAEFMEDKKGRIKEGYLADLTILDKDIFSINPIEIKEIRPVMTMVGGKIVYNR